MRRWPPGASSASSRPSAPRTTEAPEFVARATARPEARAASREKATMWSISTLSSYQASFDRTVKKSTGSRPRGEWNGPSKTLS